MADLGTVLGAKVQGPPGTTQTRCQTWPGISGKGDLQLSLAASDNRPSCCESYLLIHDHEPSPRAT